MFLGTNLSNSKAWMSNYDKNYRRALIISKPAGKEADDPHERSVPKVLHACQQYSENWAFVTISSMLMSEVIMSLLVDRIQRQSSGCRGHNVAMILAVSPSLGVKFTLTLWHKWQWHEQSKISSLPYRTYDKKHIAAGKENATSSTIEHAHVWEWMFLKPSSTASHLESCHLLLALLNSTEQAHSCFKAAVRRQLVRPEVVKDIKNSANWTPHLEQLESSYSDKNWKRNFIWGTPRKCQNWALLHVQLCHRETNLWLNVFSICTSHWIISSFNYCIQYIHLVQCCININDVQLKGQICYNILVLLLYKHFSIRNIQFKISATASFS